MILPEPGDRVRLISTNDPYTNLRSGDEGVVSAVFAGGNFVGRSVSIDWDNGSRLSMLPDEGDRFEVIR